MVKGKKWVLAKVFEGKFDESNLQLEEFDLPDVKDGEILLEAVYLTVDPYMRLMGTSIGDTMVGEQVARVIESKNAAYPVGIYVLASAGWVTHSISNGDKLSKVEPQGDLPLSLALGILGMPGRTAYIGLTKVGDPKSGETVFVSSAAGAVGSIVGQIAKILGCRVIGSAGSEEKVDYLKKLGYDEAFNYKVVDLDAKIKSLAPDGIDVYFENVGGEFGRTVIKNVKRRGRVIICGIISEYNCKEPPQFPSIFWDILRNEIKIQGFANFAHEELFGQATTQLAEWIQQDKLKYHEHVTEGFDNMAKAFVELFSGATTGKAIVKV